MRTPRIKETGPAYYHVMSRVVDKRMALNNMEKERFCRLMRAVEGFAGVQVVTFACMDNHFHIALHVPVREPVTDAELVHRLGFLYDRKEVRTVQERLEALRAAGRGEAAESLRTQYTYRMYDLSEFMKTLKQRLTQSYNSRHGRKGTLWEERFKSLLVGGSTGTLSTVAAYIDLNAVRAGIVGDPKDYRFCGYGEAVAGSKRARRGIGGVMQSLGGQEAPWGEASGLYRKFLYVRGQSPSMDTTGAPGRPGLSHENVQAVLEAGGKLSVSELLRCRVRYFADGAVLGSRTFVDEAINRHQGRFGRKRATGALPMAGGDWGGLCTARHPRTTPIPAPNAL